MRSSMDEKALDCYRRAGKIAANARKYGLGLISENVRLLDVANKIETRIRDQGAGIAFPVNISINEIAAHYSPRHDDALVFQKGNVVKLDVGVHVDGYIADTAATVEVGTNNYSKLIEASQKALQNAIGVVKNHGILETIGKVIEETITLYGFKSIDNLTGHSLDRYVLHSGLSIPNVAHTMDNQKLKVGDVIAIEPFASTGAGHIISGNGSNIYLCMDSFRMKLVRNQGARLMAQKLSSQFKTLPFAERWCQETIPGSTDVSLKKLAFLGVLKHYPQLVDKGKGIVSQAEHTVIVTEDGCEVTT